MILIPNRAPPRCRTPEAEALKMTKNSAASSVLFMICVLAAPFSSTASPESTDRLQLFGWSPQLPASGHLSTITRQPVNIRKHLNALKTPHLNAPSAQPSLATAAHQATVVKTMEAPGFNTTYMELEANGKTFWIASRNTAIKIGNTVRFSPDKVVTMVNFESKALQRTFDKIFFVPEVTVLSTN
jgi:hypothetical protein